MGNSLLCEVTRKINQVKYFGFIYFILICECIIVRGQNSNQHINIRALESQVTFDEYYSFRIDIYRNNENIKIVYSVLDSVSAKKLYVIAMAALVPPAYFTNIDSIADKKSSIIKTVFHSHKIIIFTIMI
ncbi:MAG TPA: hypothetical protein VK787_08550 [Puia sp.]|nr:hypothetical protein [Puia sp.]